MSVLRSMKGVNGNELRIKDSLSKDPRRRKSPPSLRGLPFIANLLNFADSESVRGKLIKWTKLLPKPHRDLRIAVLFVTLFLTSCLMVISMVNNTALRDIVLETLYNARRSDISRLLYDQIV